MGVLAFLGSLQIKTVIEGKGNKTETAKEYVCRSKRKVRLSAPFEYRTLGDGRINRQQHRRLPLPIRKICRKMTIGQAGPILDESCLWPSTNSSTLPRQATPPVRRNLHQNTLRNRQSSRKTGLFIALHDPKSHPSSQNLLELVYRRRGV